MSRGSQGSTARQSQRSRRDGRDNRRVVEVARTALPCCDLPENHGHWHRVYGRYGCGPGTGVWLQIMALLRSTLIWSIGCWTAHRPGHRHGASARRAGSWPCYERSGAFGTCLPAGEGDVLKLIPEADKLRCTQALPSAATRPGQDAVFRRELRASAGAVCCATWATQN